MKETSPTAAHERAGNQLLVDVREADEWAAGHAPGAVHIPLSQIPEADLPPAEEYLLVCRSGGRSGKAVDALTAIGRPATNVAGGMNAWAADGLPVITDDGSPGFVQQPS